MECKKCGCTEFSYVEAIKPKIKLRWKLLLIFLMLFTVSLTATYPEQGGLITTAFTIELLTYIGIIIYDKVTRRNTQTKAICTKCQHITWIK